MPQVGEPLTPGLAVLRRGGLPDGACDAMGPLPYSQQLAEVTPETLREALRELGATAFFATLKPGLPLIAEPWLAAGFEALRGGPHFVWNPGGDALRHSARTRFNLRRALDHWSVRSCEIADCAEEVSRMYAELFARKQMSAILNYPADHFTRLAAAPGLEMLGAFDGEGLGAVLLYARWRDEVHTLHLAGAERSYHAGAAYALFQHLWEREHATATLYLGGAPRAANAAGIARFKQRFANSTATPWVIRAILDSAACLRLQEHRGSHAWFPPYRSQYGD